jgi:hypothetical protein
MARVERPAAVARLQRTGRSALNWVFRDRRTGAIVIGQFPNVPLLAWLALSALGWVWHPPGAWGTALAVTTTAALGLWAVDELMRGVNPWRRALGAAVLCYIVVSWAAAH